MCDTTRSEKAPSEREETSSTTVQPGSPCHVPAATPVLDPLTRAARMPKSQKHPSKHRRDASDDWLPDLTIDGHLPMTPPSSGRRRRVSEIIADDEAPKPDKMWNSLSNLLEEEKARKASERRAAKRQKAGPRGRTANGAAKRPEPGV